jgi:serine/threonine protein kinase
VTPAQWQRVTALFGEARVLPDGERAAFVTREGGDDPVVRDEVLALLEADREDAFLERGALVQPADLLDEAGGHTFEPGTSLGPYRIERLLARGGMGVLYVGIDTRLGRRVTLKVLPAAMARDPRARARLQREARTAAQLRHPHIVSVHALEELGDTLVIVAEYVEGPTLAEVLRDRGPLDRVRWHALARALASALVAAHAAQVIHRDVKSSNIVLGADGLRLVDFGIALTQANGGDTRLTRAGQSAGTPLAQAPEQLEGGPATMLSDQFAFGLVLYEAASARLPYGDGALAGVWARMLRDEPQPLSAVAPQLSVEDVVLVHRCLSRRPEDRFASMRDVTDALDAAPFDDRDRSPGRDRSPSGPSPDHAPDALTHGDSAHREVGRLGQSSLPTVTVTSKWWDVHQAVTATLYVGLLWPGWLVASTLSGRWRVIAHLALVCLAAVATSLRLHLWFSARHYPDPIAATRRGWWPVATGIDVLYAGLLGGMALAAADVRLVAAVVTAGLAVCLLMASLVIEPATRRAVGIADANK